MTEQEKIDVARWALYKGVDYETLGYSDNMYGKREFLDDVWEYVIAAQENGMIWFDKTYN